MQYVIDTSKPININWGATGNERIVQNVLNIINTWKYEVAYNREMGIDSRLLDKPKDIAAAQYIAEVYRIVPIYEPRAEVKEVTFLQVDDEGVMQFKVVVNI